MAKDDLEKLYFNPATRNQIDDSFWVAPITADLQVPSDYLRMNETVQRKNLIFDPEEGLSLHYVIERDEASGPHRTIRELLRVPEFQRQEGKWNLIPDWQKGSLNSFDVPENLEDLVKDEFMEKDGFMEVFE
jgi:hypothetical protein